MERERERTRVIALVWQQKETEQLYSLQFCTSVKMTSEETLTITIRELTIRELEMSVVNIVCMRTSSRLLSSS